MIAIIIIINGRIIKPQDRNEPYHIPPSSKRLSPGTTFKKQTIPIFDWEGLS